MKSLNTWKFIVDSYTENIPVMLLYVLESSGSSPGRQGFFMAVNAKGGMEGSIGGGIMEHKFVELAKEELRAASFELRASEVRKQVHDKSAAKNQSGMICSGEQTIWVYRIREEDVSQIHSLIYSLEQHLNGKLTLSPLGVLFEDPVPEKNFELTFNDETDWVYTEKTGHKNLLSIVGGGHCSLAFSKLMRSMDFYIRVYDDRRELRTMSVNDSAHELIILKEYEDLKWEVEAGQDHYVVIMTFGYRTDDIALRALIDKDFKYLGLLGSKKKIEKMFKDYRAAGISEERLQRIHTPVGLPIKSQTPEEIAVSIAAEIIKVKNKDL